jgi:hypothetical protein
VSVPVSHVGDFWLRPGLQERLKRVEGGRCVKLKSVAVITKFGTVKPQTQQVHATDMVATRWYWW